MIIQGDCLEVMRSFPDNHFSCIVTDPPYGLHFMGKDWDSFKYKQEHGLTGRFNLANSNTGTYDERRNDEFQSFMRKAATEALRILKPGGHFLMFGAPRRFHRQTCALEDAGFEIRDCIMWLFGSGFPKSHNRFGIDGYGTALKPAYEPIIMAMKPCDGTFAQNAGKWGQAGINIDGCRIRTKEQWKSSGELYGGFSLGKYGDGLNNPGRSESHSKGRWPSNLLLDEEAAKMLDEQTGMLKSGKLGKINHVPIDEVYKHGRKIANINLFEANSGGASRFFYCAKASSAERNEGLEKMPLKQKKTLNDYVNPSEGRTASKSGSSMQNNHPTVKPLKLMEYIIKLVMPPKDGLLLDPFAGSGTTILAAKNLGFNAIGIEKNEEYCEIARKRIEDKPIDQLDLFKEGK